MWNRSPLVSVILGRAASSPVMSAAARSACCSASRRVWISMFSLRWWARSRRRSRLTSFWTVECSSSSGLPDEMALASAADRALESISSISRLSSLPRMSWAMKVALRSTPCHMYASKDRSVTNRTIATSAF
jgi:hypothetical protein